MTVILDVLVALLLLAGSGFILVAGIGVVRMEDVFTRMHASTKAGTLGLGLIVTAILLDASSAAMAEKALALFLLVLATAPVAAHLVGRAVWRVMTPRQREACAPSNEPNDA